jgi:hypothetical protein
LNIVWKEPNYGEIVVSRPLAAVARVCWLAMSNFRCLISLGILLWKHWSMNPVYISMALVSYIPVIVTYWMPTQTLLWHLLGKYFLYMYCTHIYKRLTFLLSISSEIYRNCITSCNLKCCHFPCTCIPTPGTTGTTDITAQRG